MADPTLSQSPLRMRAALAVIIVVGLFLGAKLFYWQILQMDDLANRGGVQRDYSVPLYARRGNIVTADGTLLATDVFQYSISVSPKDIRNADEAAKALAPLLGQSFDVVLAKLKSTDSNVMLASNVMQSVAGPVQALKDKMMLTGLKIEGKPIRLYPAGAFAAQVIGYVNVQRQPAYGVEQFKDTDLRGTNGEIHGSSNAYRSDIIPFDLPTNKPAIDGARITLTLNSGVQRLAETELGNAVKDTRAAGGTVIVMEVKTGAILAMASSPTADLNGYFDSANQGRYSNPAVSAQYEPGSVFKVVTVACALDAGTVSPGSVFDDNGSIIITGRTIKNHEDIAPGRVTLTDVLRQSLNVEAVKISVGLGADRFYQCVQRFGFGTKTRVELASETTGDVKSVGDGRWHEIDLATNAFGQGLAATPLQMLMAVNVVANQGKLVRPYIVQGVQSSNGKVQKTSAEVVRQVIRPTTAQTLTRILADAIIAESSSKAVVPGYRIAGKTGTSQIPIAGTLDPRWTIASFAGYLPADDPQYIILVKLDKPQTSEWGSQVASPVFAAVAKQLVSIVGLPPDSSRLASK